MSKTVKIGFIGLVVLGVMAVLMAGSVLASQVGPTLTATVDQLQGPGRGGPGAGPGPCGEAGLEAAAEALGMTGDDLSNELWAGRTLADVAERAEVDLQTIRDAVEAACQTARLEAIEQAVEDGNLSREEADWLLEGIENDYMGGRLGRGFERGFGRAFGPSFDKGPGGFHGFQRGGPGDGSGFQRGGPGQAPQQQ